MKARAKTFDFILSTVSAEVDWNMYLHLLKPDGKVRRASASALLHPRPHRRRVPSSSWSACPTSSPSSRASSSPTG